MERDQPGAQPREPAPAPPADRPPLVVNVGFTGHRTLGGEAAAHASMAAVLAEVRAMLGQITAAPLAAAYAGRPGARLLIGAAPGADRLMTAAWQSMGLGEAHAFYPFRDPLGGGACTDLPAHGDPATRISPPPQPASWTGIDALGLGLAEGEAHAEVARWIVGHAQALIAWWDGEPGRGAGGTADTVSHALERGLPVIWLSPGGGEPRLIDPRRPGGDASPEDASEPLSAAALASVLTPDLVGTGPTSTDVDGDLQQRIAEAVWPLGLCLHGGAAWSVQAAQRAASPRRGWVDPASFSLARRWAIQQLSEAAGDDAALTSELNVAADAPYLQALAIIGDVAGRLSAVPYG